MDEVERLKLKKIYSEVLLGRSSAPSKLFGKVFIRHIDPLLSAELDEMNALYLEQATGHLPSTKQREIEIFEQGLWTKKEENKLRDERLFLNGLRAGKSKTIRKQEAKAISDKIIETEKSIRDLEEKRFEAIGNTAESWSIRKMNEFYIFRCSYKDSELSNPLFDPSEFDELDAEQITELSSLYATYSSCIVSKTLKKIAVSGFFLNYFQLCNDAVQFYGKHVSALTFYQVELFGYGRYFRDILSEYRDRIPEDVLNDPDKLIDWYGTTKNAEQALDKLPQREGSMQTIVGASKEDMDALRKNPSNKIIDLSAETRKAGRDLSLLDIVKLQNM